MEEVQVEVEDVIVLPSGEENPMFPLSFASAIWRIKDPPENPNEFTLVAADGEELITVPRPGICSV